MLHDQKDIRNNNTKKQTVVNW